MLNFVHMIQQAVIQTDAHLSTGDSASIKSVVCETLEHVLMRGYTPTYRTVRNTEKEIVERMGRQLLHYESEEKFQNPFIHDTIIFKSGGKVCDM